jgi:integrase
MEGSRMERRMVSRRVKITKRSVDDLIENGATGDLLRDLDLKGYLARKNADKSVSYLAEYRPGRGRAFKVQRPVLGRHGAITPDEARASAKEVLAKAALGKGDLAAERAKARKEPTVAEFLRHVLETHWRAKKKASTAKNFEGMIERTLIREFGAKKLSALKRADIRIWHASQTHRPRQANLDVAILRKAMALALADELITENPATGIAFHAENKRDRIPTDAEMKRLLEAIEVAPTRPQAALLFKLLIFTGARAGEWRAAEWAWLSDDGKTLNLPDAAAKAGARPLALSSMAQALLTEAPRVGRYVVPKEMSGEGANEPLPSWTINDQWEIVRRASGVKDVRVHDLRHGFGTRGGALGASALVIRDALGHKTLAMTGRYVSRQNDPVRSLAERIGKQIEAVKTGKPAKLVRLKKGGP